MEEVRLHGEELGRLGLRTPPADKNRAIRKAAEENHSIGGAV